MAVTTYYNLGETIIAEESGGVRVDYAVDGLGSVTGTLVGGALQNTYAYKPYGDQLAKTGVGADPDFTWCGTAGYRRAANSSPYVRTRHYSTSSARWLSVDLLWPVENAFGYANSNPIALADPSGLAPCYFDPLLGKPICNVEPCIKPCKKDPCAYVSNHYPGVLDDENRTVCCGGGFFAKCLAKGQIPPKTPTRIRAPLEKCIRCHEQEHVDQCKKNPGDCVCGRWKRGPSGNWDGPATCGIVFFKTPRIQSADECGGYSKEVECIMATLAKACQDDPTSVFCNYLCGTCQSSHRWCSQAGASGWPSTVKKFCEANKKRCKAEYRW